MTVNKKCDCCGKEVINKNNELGYSEWCVYHFKKRRDFCSDKCMASFWIAYFLNKFGEEYKKDGNKNDSK